MPVKKKENIQEIRCDDIWPFKDHPFKVVDDEAMLRTVESVAEYGVLAPLILRPMEGCGYEVISGHRRLHAAELARLETVPAIVRELNDDEATILMVDSNLQREHILPSERAWAYRMKLEAMKHQGKRTDLEEPTSCQIGTKLRSDALMAENSEESARTIQRYIRLTYLIPELLQMVDDKQIAFNPAVELSYLTEKHQRDFLEAMEYSQNTPSLSQAQRLKRMSQMNRCAPAAIRAVMMEDKKDSMDKVSFKGAELRKYFPKSYTPQQMSDTIIKLLSQWQKKRQRDMSL